VTVFAHGIDADGTRHPLTVTMEPTLGGALAPSVHLDGRAFDRVEVVYAPDPPIRIEWETGPGALLGMPSVDELRDAGAHAMLAPLRAEVDGAIARMSADLDAERERLRAEAYGEAVPKVPTSCPECGKPWPESRTDEGRTVWARCPHHCEWNRCAMVYLSGGRPQP
jgi:hypothetical protein